MNISNNIILVLVIFLLIPAFSINLPSISIASTHKYDDKVVYPFLNVTDKVVFKDMDIIVNGNIDVSGNGSLILLNSSLYINSTSFKGFHFIIRSGGTLIVSHSNITGPRDRYYWLFAEPNSHIKIVYSRISNAGWKDQRGTDEYLYIEAAYTRDYSYYGHGLEFNTTVREFYGNIFINIASMRFYSSNNLVENNTFIGTRHEAIAFINSNNNIVRYNTILDASVRDRETHGIRFYPGCRNNTIFNNHIEGVINGIIVANIPPWDAGVKFLIKGNYIRRVFNGITGKFIDSVLENNTIEYIWSKGIMLEASRDVLVKNNVIRNMSYCIDEIISDEYYEEVKDIVGPKPFLYFAIMQRGGIMIGWSAKNISIINNYIGYAPPYGYGIGFDVKYIAYDINISNNLIEHIGDGYYVGKPCFINNRSLCGVSTKGLKNEKGCLLIALRLVASCRFFLIICLFLYISFKQFQ